MSKKQEKQPKSDPLKPSVTLLMKLGSAVVHAEEYLSQDSHPFDLNSFERMSQDPEVVQWIKDMGAMLPQKRKG